MKITKNGEKMRYTQQLIASDIEKYIEQRSVDKNPDSRETSAVDYEAQSSQNTSRQMDLYTNSKSSPQRT